MQVEKRVACGSELTKGGVRKGRNLRSTLKRRRRSTSPMQAFDALPPELRHWLATACLPWSPESARKIWNAADGATNPEHAISRLNVIERSMLQKDAGIWQSAGSR